MNDDGLTAVELSAFLRRLAALEWDAQPRLFPDIHFLAGRASSLLAVAELVERGEIRAGLLSEPISRLHFPKVATVMPEH